MNIKNVLIIIGQVVVVSFALFFGLILIYMKIPGNGALCDAEQIILVGTWAIFLPLVFGIVINSWINYAKGKWKKYRIATISIITILLFLSIFLRPIIMKIYYGKEQYIIESKNPIFIKIQLFENGNFFAYTYDINCESENTGTYNLKGDMLKLNFKKEKSNYLGTEYRIKNEDVKCLNCDHEYELKIK